MGVIREIQEDLEAGARRLFSEYHSRLLAEARSLCPDSDSAEDLVMLTLETYFAKPEKYDPSKGELMTWLKAVMRNHFRKSLRRKSHIDTIFLPADDLQVVAERLQAGEARPEPEGTESDELIRRAVASLSPKVRDAVILHYFKGQPVDKTASALGISVEAAKNRLFCARQILQARLKGRLGKSLAVLAVLLLGVATLFGAYQLVEKVEEVGKEKVEEVEEVEKVEEVGGRGILSASEQDEPSASVSQGGAAVPAAQNEKAISNNDQQTTTQQAHETQTQEKQTMKLTQTFAAAALAVTAAVVTVEADGITLQLDQAKQRYPWNGLVDIDYTITYDTAATLGADDNLEVMMVNHDVTPAVTNRAITFLQAPLPLTEGSHRVTWDANADDVTNLVNNAEFIVKIRHYSEAYMVIDVSAGSGANAIYPVDFLNGAPPNGFNTPEYKGDKIVLRRIHPGSYMAGSPANEANRANTAVREKQHRVALSQPFYIGVFEVTQQQYLNVMGGTNPSEHKGDDGVWQYRPVEKVSWNTIRGGTWPNGKPGTNSFMDKLIQRCKSKDPSTGEYTVKVEGFDLPTDFQWEYACRAGTTNAFNTATPFDNTDSAKQVEQLKLLGRYTDNQSDNKGGISTAHTIVGSYLPNAWGLYDMHGNVWEWCRDWYIEDPTTLNPKQYKDPVGAASGSTRVKRGGSWNNSVGNCRSAFRGNSSPSYVNADIGFRLSRTLP